MKPLKANFILGKKQIVLASLVLILGVAVYLNWQFANTSDDLSLTSALDETQGTEEVGAPVDETDASVIPDLTANPDEIINPDGTKNLDTILNTGADTEETADPAAAKTPEEELEDVATKGKNLGDALLVNAKSIADETYFVMAKLTRTKSRDLSIETISTVLNDPKLTDDDKKEVSAKAMAITDIIEAESRIENLIKAKGFEECVVYITQKNANVVVKTDGLDQDKATQIKNIIVSEGKIAGENVTITEIN